MSDYTPTDLEVKVAFMAAAGHKTFRGERHEAYDRWLASVKAEAWDEGYDSGDSDGFYAGEQGGIHDKDRETNPYREVTE